MGAVESTQYLVFNIFVKQAAHQSHSYEKILTYERKT